MLSLRGASHLLAMPALHPCSAQPQQQSQSSPRAGLILLSRQRTLDNSCTEATGGEERYNLPSGFPPLILLRHPCLVLVQDFLLSAPKIGSSTSQQNPQLHQCSPATKSTSPAPLLPTSCLPIYLFRSGNPENPW